MIHTMCTIYDIKACSYTPPLFFPSRGTAIRAFIDEVNRADDKNMYYRHPADFVFYLVGSFDDQTLKFNLLEPPELLVSGSDVAVSV